MLTGKTKVEKPQSVLVGYEQVYAQANARNQLLLRKMIKQRLLMVKAEKKVLNAFGHQKYPLHQVSQRIIACNATFD